MSDPALRRSSRVRRLIVTALVVLAGFGTTLLPLHHLPEAKAALTQVATGTDHNGKQFALPFIPSKTPFAINMQQVYADEVGIYQLSNTCRCIVLSDGSTKTTIDSVGAQDSAFPCGSWPCDYGNSTGGALQMVVFKKLTVDSSSPTRIFQDVGTAGNGYHLELTAPGTATFGGTSAGGNPMYTVVWGRLWWLSIAGTCWFNWSGALGTFTGLSAGGYCVGMSAYAIQTFDADPTPSPLSNPVNIPSANLTVTSK